MVVLSSNLYETTTVDPVRTMEEVYKLLEKFGITEKRFTDLGPTNSFLELIIRRPDKTAIRVKIDIPFIEDQVGKGYSRKQVYNKPRSFRVFYHYVKGLLSAKEAEIKTIEEIFMAHIVTNLPDGTETTLGENLNRSLSNGVVPELVGFNVKPSSNALPHPPENPPEALPKTLILVKKETPEVD
jgi:hypothetical protein